MSNKKLSFIWDTFCCQLLYFNVLDGTESLKRSKISSKCVDYGILFIFQNVKCERQENNFEIAINTFPYF